MRKITIEELIPFVHSLNAEFRYFHLTPCICGAPSWKQPCPFCGFYPIGYDPIERKRCEGRCAQLFKALVGRLPTEEELQGVDGAGSWEKKTPAV